MKMIGLACNATLLSKLDAHRQQVDIASPLHSTQTPIQTRQTQR